MKGLMAVMMITLLCGTAALAGPLEFFVGGGPSAAALGDINTNIEVINAIIRDLNDTPIYDGAVPVLPSLGNGLSYQAGERYWITDRFALGGKLEYFQARSTTAGTYTTIATSDVSNINVDLRCQSIGLIFGGRFTFLDVGLRLAIDLGVGYYYSGLDTSITFEIPADYPPLSIQLPNGNGHYNGSSIGIEGGVSLSFPLTNWLNVGTSVLYRSLTVQQVADAQGNGFDMDGDGMAEVVDLSGITVQFTISLDIDLAL